MGNADQEGYTARFEKFSPKKRGYVSRILRAPN